MIKYIYIYVITCYSIDRKNEIRTKIWTNHDHSLFDLFGDYRKTIHGPYIYRYIAGEWQTRGEFPVNER